ncbi:lipid IV(A) 3-deoxy-D-manno-octulosonic acid transferase [Alteromonadaceae bacterium BrNp21-10]|nr:lipid IV(A) 3-deoxy-D-manno-octulosonic acid transferase [Alteromonadaceae bacterium BrNp21-10]
MYSFNNNATTLTTELCRGLYSLLFSLLLPLFFLSWLGRLILGKQTVEWRRIQRFGIHLPKQTNTETLLIHCVSMGEVTAASHLIEVLLEQNPSLSVVVSTTTTSGAQQVNTIFADRVQHCYLPYDVPLLTRWFLYKIQPQQVLITEVELWPNLVNLCWRKHIPVSVINARMTARSMKQYQRIKALFNPMLHQLNKVCAQGQRDFDHYCQLGIAADKLHLTGNMKFDLEVGKLEQQAPIFDNNVLKQRFVLIAGSTHEPEEQLLLAATQQLLKSIPELLLIIVPRHPQRFEETFTLCQQSQLNTARFSSQQPLDQKTKVLLVDAIGVLKQLYALADVAFVGGSIAHRGGHNPLEAAAFSVPILMGPSQHNNPEICSTLADVGALKDVAEQQDIITQVEYWYANSDVRQSAGLAGQQILHDNAGATQKTLSLLF